jgi:hypothetical protein
MKFLHIFWPHLGHARSYGVAWIKESIYSRGLAVLELISLRILAAVSCVTMVRVWSLKLR